MPKPDAERGALVKAFVVARARARRVARARAELQAHVRGKLAPYEYPKEIEFIDALPMTTTGKVQRRVLRLREERKRRRRVATDGAAVGMTGGASARGAHALAALT